MLLLLLLDLRHNLGEIVRRRRLHRRERDIGLKVIQSQLLTDGQQVPVVDVQPARIAGYLGNSDKFDEAIADFSIAYADQSEQDHKILMKAVSERRLEVVREGI